MSQYQSPQLSFTFWDEAACKKNLFGSVHVGTLQNHLLNVVNSRAKDDIIGT